MDTAPQNPTACPAGTDRRTEQQGWAAARLHRAPSYPNHHEGISKAISQEMRLIHSLPKHQENPQEIPWDPEPNTHAPPSPPGGSHSWTPAVPFARGGCTGHLRQLLLQESSSSKRPGGDPTEHISSKRPPRPPQAGRGLCRALLLQAAA